MSQNEDRAVIGYTPIANSHGQRFFTSHTLVPLEDAGETEADAQNVPTTPQSGTPGARKAIPLGLRLIAGDVAGRMARRLTTHAEKAARSDMRKWLIEGIYEHRSVIAEAFGPIVAACQEFGLNVPTAEQVADFLLTRFVANPRAQSWDEVEDFRNHVIAFLSPG